MKHVLFLGGLLLVAACNSSQSVNSADPQATAQSADQQLPTEQPPAAATGAAATSAEQATAIATRYFRSRPDSAVYLLSTMSVLDAGPRWQVLVKRSDRVGIKPDNSAIEVDKQTGAISTVPVK